MKVALCFAVCLLLMVGLKAEDSSSNSSLIKIEIINGPRVTYQECQEIYDVLMGYSYGIPSAADQSCYNAIVSAYNPAEPVCSSVCQSLYNAAVQCYGQYTVDAYYENFCGPGGFNSAGSTTVYISLLVIAAFLAVFATVF